MKYTGEIDLYIYVRKEEASSSPSSEETHAIYDFQDFYVKRNYPKRLWNHNFDTLRGVRYIGVFEIFFIVWAASHINIFVKWILIHLKTTCHGCTMIKKYKINAK